MKRSRCIIPWVAYGFLLSVVVFPSLRHPLLVSVLLIVMLCLRLVPGITRSAARRS
jgi:hypothetical protein